MRKSGSDDNESMLTFGAGSPLTRGQRWMGSLRCAGRVEVHNVRIVRFGLGADYSKEKAEAVLKRGSLARLFSSSALFGTVASLSSRPHPA